MLFGIAACLSLLQLSIQVEAAVICPSDSVISPCACSQYTTSTSTLDCAGKNVNDSQASDILDAYLTIPGVSPVGDIELYYNPLLTHIPVQVKSFTQLVMVNLSPNSLTTIESDAFNLSDAANPLRYLDLSSNQLATIAPGAFRGFRLIESILFTLSSNDLLMQELNRSTGIPKYFCTQINWRVSNRPSSSRFSRQWLRSVDLPTPMSKYF